MNQLRIRLFATLTLRLGEERLPAFPTRSARSLFAYLVLHRRRLHPRQKLMGTFWGKEPESSARKRLRTALWRVRSVVEPEGEVEPGRYITVGSQGIGFDPAVDYWLDVEVFESRLRAFAQKRGKRHAPEARRLLEEALDLYRGDLLEGVYEEWSLLEQERLRRLYVTALERLMRRAADRSDWTRAISCGHRILQIDSLREHVHRDLMRLYYLRGNRPGALRQFSRCRRILREAFDGEPMEKTKRLVRAIETESDELPGTARSSLELSAAGGEDAPASEADSEAARLDEVVHELRDTLQSIRQEVDALSETYGGPGGRNGSRPGGGPSPSVRET